MEKRLLGYVYQWSCYYLGWWWTSSVCYNNYEGYSFGCFDTAQPFCNADEKLPEDPFKKIKITFELYTRSNVGNKQLIDIFKENSVTTSNFDETKKTVVIIHGFRGSSSDQWVIDMRKTLLQNENVNVIAVDWAAGANDALDYYQAVANTRIVGAVTGHMILMLRRLTQISFDQFHIVGHSLGAHAAGYAGETMKDFKLGRITGLDPAKPAFEDWDAIVRLDATDATYVDVIHTDIKWFGIESPIGHADFYPNNGYDQPGCESLSEVFLSSFTDFEGAAEGIACNHLRAIYLFVSSISCTNYNGKPCSSEDDAKNSMCESCGNGCNAMGYNSANIIQPQTYYLTTDSVSPFCYKSSVKRVLGLLKKYSKKLIA